MKILHLNTWDINGGAARAAFRLHQGLRTMGLSSQMLVQEKTSDDPTVFGSPTQLNQGIARSKNTLDLLPLKFFYPNRDSVSSFSLQWLPDRVTANVAQHNPDIIHLHWICGGFTQIETLKRLQRPIIWTLHDMWPFTGGCHYSGQCDRYQQSCGQCPQLNPHQTQDMSRWVWQRKLKAWKELDLTLITPSTWLSDCARRSALFQALPIETIPNGIDTRVYRPIEKHLARKLLGLPLDKKLILFGSIKATQDRRKGFHLLQPALKQLSQSGWEEQAEVVIIGASKPSEAPDLGLKTHYLGTQKDDLTLALIYSCADLFVLPSTEDNLPNTLMEALACGIPCVGFKIGGIPDLIEHQQNGYLAQAFEVEDLAQGIAWILDDPARYQKLAQRARAKVEQEFSLDIQSQHCSSLYLKVLERARSHSHSKFS
jgi:glycosyltransferase involved in cell wall biosynthesis